MQVMPTEDEVVEAFNAIDAAWSRYRTTLRAYIEDGVAEGASGRQARLVERLGRTREMLRQDAMTDEQRDALRQTEAQRRRAAKTAR